MIRELVYGSVAVVLFAYAVEFGFSIGDDPREPPRVRSTIPLIGHVLGILKGGPTHYTKTGKSTPSEIHTLGVFNYKIYVSTSSRLLPIIQKQSKSLSFRPFLQITARKHGDASDETYAIFGGTLPDELSNVVRLSLAPGPYLDDQNMRMGKRVQVEVDALLGRGSTKQINLLEWSRHIVVQSSSCGVYGDQHPLMDPEVEKSFWDWQNYLTAHLAGVDFLGKGYAARQKVYDAYIKYFKEFPVDGSQLAREHQRMIREAGIGELDNAKQASLFTIAVFSNTAPTLYWTLWEIFSRPQILEEIRQELRAHAVSGSKNGGFVLNVSALKTQSPLLVSVFQETQRTRHVNASFRQVMTDTLLDGKYLLKAGNFLQMPGEPIHANTSIWGPTALEFDPYRFLSKGIPQGGFVGFGSPPHLCPARQFASTEIFIIAALLIMRADMLPVAGAWDKAPALNYSDLSTLLNPKRDVKVEVKAREAWAGEWTLKMGESRTRIPLASG
ncbi:cytochrome P450 [Stachybotrys elegans]|uniref:Cytochrome P450 n=1 Tax=Stachybotrys elegans TaxID=80388 RepID=A0A8K0T5K0_9HYPO|nr:cytochrome P450 [Stachybotrys elegans]